MTIKLKPFLTPNFAIMEMPPGKREDGFKELPSVPLPEIDATELASMCDAFRAEIFRKAGKADPLSK